MDIEKKKRVKKQIIKETVFLIIVNIIIILLYINLENISGQGEDVVLPLSLIVIFLLIIDCRPVLHIFLMKREDNLMKKGKSVIAKVLDISSTNIICFWEDEEKNIIYLFKSRYIPSQQVYEYLKTNKNVELQVFFKEENPKNFIIMTKSLEKRIGE